MNEESGLWELQCYFFANEFFGSFGPDTWVEAKGESFKDLESGREVILAKTTFRAEADPLEDMSEEQDAHALAEAIIETAKVAGASRVMCEAVFRLSEEVGNA